MERKVVSRIMLILLLIGILILTFNVQLVKASGTIYIRADGSVEGTTHILTVDNVTYTFTDNIYDEIVVERDNIVVDGAAYTLQGTGSGKGIFLGGVSNVTIKNMEIKAFDYAIYLRDSSNNKISGNNITNNWGDIWLGGGIWLYWSSNNTIYGNNITNNKAWGIGLHGGSNSNTISGNNITNNYYDGIYLEDNLNNKISGNTITANNRFGIYIVNDSNNNTISGNSITANNDVGIVIECALNNTIFGNTIMNNENGVFLDSSSNNKFYHNNFINNTEQAYTMYSTNNTWDDGYPSGGNFWSDHNPPDVYSGPYQNETGSDGIGDTPYVIDENNQDNYPLMNPVWTPENEIWNLVRDMEDMNLQQGIDNSFDAKLTAALDALEALNADQRNDAINKLNAFINEVEAQREKKLTNEQADYLVATAQESMSLFD